MDGTGVSSDQVEAEMLDMGFEYSCITRAIEAVGPSLNEVVDYALTHSARADKNASTSINCSFASRANTLEKRLCSSVRAPRQMRQSSIREHFHFMPLSKRSKTINTNVTNTGGELLAGTSEECCTLKELHTEEDRTRNPTSESTISSHALDFPHEQVERVALSSDWESKVNEILQKQFGYSSLKSFQKEALSAWLDHQDCLVLAATGSGKSLCFQIPALLTGKVVVVISPLISLMHDQCLKLSKHGVSACFLGSGQPDSSVERKAMEGMYQIIYVCPETVLRLIKALQRLAETRGIALFAIDEVHCVSKWGHDFRPDFRKLSILRESFTSSNLKFLKVDVPIMALTATATVRVRKDILESLCMSKETKIVLTSFFRPNLRFSVKHSRTSSSRSYENDFHELVEMYSKKTMVSDNRRSSASHDLEDVSDVSSSTTDGGMTGASADAHEITDDGTSKDVSSSMKKGSGAPMKELSVEYLEDDFDDAQTVDDLDVSCGEFFGQPPGGSFNITESTASLHQPFEPEERCGLLQRPLEQGPTIIYVPTRKETLRIANFLCSLGVKAAAYNAALPKAHLRRVHKEFHENALHVVVATIAFGMGIDKLNVRRIIHYGWPQSLEAYYQEAGRGGRDGKLADCVLYANLSRIPTLLPSRRSQEQTKQAYKMLGDCFRYGMDNSRCRAKILVEYFGEQFSYGKCMLCDVCANGPPELQNLKAEASIFMQVVAAASAYDDFPCRDMDNERSSEKPDLRTLVTKIREHSQIYLATDQLWWRGLARILEDKGLIREGGDTCRVQIKCPEITQKGLRYMESGMDEDVLVHPEADMLLSATEEKRRPHSTFAEWGKGWADPVIRRQRLEQRRARRKPRKRKSRRSLPEMNRVRGRLAVKLSKMKR
ncbi:hypothetical protein Dimus_039820 [Dionaea muscipula]